MIQQREVDSDQRLFQKLCRHIKIVPEAQPHFDTTNYSKLFGDLLTIFEDKFMNILRQLNEKILKLQESVKILELQKFTTSIPMNPNYWQEDYQTTKKKPTIIPQKKFTQEGDSMDIFYTQLRKEIKQLKSSLQNNHHCMFHEYPYREQNYGRRMRRDSSKFSRNTPFSIKKSEEFIKISEQKDIQTKYEELSRRFLIYREALIEVRSEMRQYRQVLSKNLSCECCQLRKLIKNFLSGSGVENWEEA